MTHTEQEAYLNYTVEQHTAWITFRRPRVLNALPTAGWRTLTSLLKRAAADPDVRAVALTGEGRAFCVGDDIRELASLQSAEAIHGLFFDAIYSAMEAILTCPKPVIAAVNGYAFGGGCEIVLLCDLAVAVDSASFAQPEARIGAWPGMMVVFGPAVLGLKHVNELVITGEPIPARRAAEIGLVNRVVPDGQLRDAVQALVRSISQASPRALQASKEIAVTPLLRQLQDLRVSLVRFVVETLPAEDFREGTRAFLEKRRPPFALE